MGPTPHAALVAPLLLLVVAGWSLLPQSATLAWAWPWFPVWFIGLAILLPLSALALALPGAVGAAQGREKLLRGSLMLFLCAPLAASFGSADPARAAAAAGGLALGVAAVFVLLARPEVRSWLRPGGTLALGATVFAVAWVTITLATSAVPFGLAGLAESFALLLLPFPVSRLLAGRGKPLPLAAIAGLLALLAAAESQLVPFALGTGLVTGVLAYGEAARRERPLLWCALVVAVFVVLFAGKGASGETAAPAEIFPIWQDQVRAAWICGWERFPLGAGEGAAPAAYERLRPLLDAPGEGLLRFPAAPAHLWAVFGLPGLAALLLAAASVWRLRARGLLAPHLGGLAAWAVMALGDAHLDQPGIALLLGLHLAILVLHSGEEASPAPSRRAWFSCGALALWLPFLGVFLSRHLPAHVAIEDYFEQPADSALAADLVERNQLLTPADPYLRNTHALRLLELEPPDHARAVAALEASLRTNPHQEFPHTWLGWLLLEKQSSKAAGHFRAALHLNPDVPGLGEGLGQALLASGKTGEAIKAFAAHGVQFPHFLLGGRWQDPRLKPIQKEVLEEAVAAAEKLLREPGLPGPLAVRVGRVRALADARLQGQGEAVLRGQLAPHDPRLRLFFEAWDNPAKRRQISLKALARRFRSGQAEDRVLGLEKLFAQAEAGGDPLLFFLIPQESFAPRIRRTGFGALQGHTRSLSPELPWPGPLGLPEAVFFSEAGTGLRSRDFDLLLGTAGQPGS